MLVLGIDPGSSSMGFGVISEEAGRLTYITSGVTKFKEKDPRRRLSLLKETLVDLIKTHAPDLIGVERLFFARNKKTALEVSQARGAIMLTLIETGVRIIEPTPAQVKQAVTNYGAADKIMIHKMVLLLLNQATLKGDDNAIDALAIAITAANTMRTERAS